VHFFNCEGARKPTQPLDERRQHVEEAIDVASRRRAAKGYSNRTARADRLKSDGRGDM
jgi:hypothetical protein